MAPRLRILCSSSQAYPPTEPISVNSSTPTKINTGSFQGAISVWIKDFNGEKKGGDGIEYFDIRTGLTYGIVVRGRFLNGPNADQVVFGNVFEKPIRDSLPWGTAVAMKFMNLVEPTMQVDIYGDKPWALAPVLASMNYLSMTKDEIEGTIVEENVEGLTDRKKHFANEENRKATSLKDTFVGMEFANGFLDFNTLSVTLPPPFHLSIPLLKYWDGQPVTYICRSKPAEGESPVDPKGVYWSVAFEIVDEEAKKELEERGGEEVEMAPKDISDDVD